MIVKQDSGKDVMIEELGVRDGSIVYVKDLGKDCDHKEPPPRTRYNWLTFISQVLK